MTTMVPGSTDMDAVFSGTDMNGNGATTTSSASGMAANSSTRSNSGPKWATAWKDFSQKTQQASREFAQKTSLKSKEIAQQTQLAYKNVAQSTSEQSKKLAESTKQSSRSMTNWINSSKKQPQMKEFGAQVAPSNGGDVDLAASLEFAGSNKTQADLLAEAAQSQQPKRDSANLLKQLEISTSKLAENAKQSSQKFVESTIQSSQKWKEISKRETELFMQQVQQQRQKSGSNKTNDEDDILVETMEIALEALMEMIAAKQQQDPDISSSGKNKWEMEMTPIVDKDAMDHQDIYKVFLNWAREAKKEKDSSSTPSPTTPTAAGLLPPSTDGGEGEEIITFSHDEDDEEEEATPNNIADFEEKKGGQKQKKEDDSHVHVVYYYNVTKAFQRLETYVDWMERHRKELTNLTTESIADAARAWNFKLQTSKEGRLVWYVDVGSMNVDAIMNKQQGQGGGAGQSNKTKKNGVTLTDSLRWLVFLSHVVMFHHSTNSTKDGGLNGIVVVFSMGNNTTMVESVTLLPMMEKLAKKLDKFTIGTLPIKLDKIYILPSQQQRWVGIVANLMKALLSKKLKNRVCVVQNGKKGGIENNISNGSSNDGNNGLGVGNNNNKVSVAQLLDKLGKDRVPVKFAGVGGTCPQDIVFGQYVNSAETEAAILAAALEGDEEDEEDNANNGGGTTGDDGSQQGGGTGDVAPPAGTAAAGTTFVIVDEDEDDEAEGGNDDDI